MITFIAALCLFTTVKTESSGLQVQTVKIGNKVTIKCDQTLDKENTSHFLVWYKQSLGQGPKFVVRSFTDNKKPRFALDFAAGRFTVDGTFDLSISETKQEDEGTYFCGTVISNIVEFGSGTLLFLQADKLNDNPPTETVIKGGDSATLQCSVQPLSCSEDHSVYWFRHGSGESDPGIIFSHGNRSDQCKKSSETVSPTQSCIYKLPKNNLSLSDGTYYCAVAACGEILFGNGTSLTFKGDDCMEQMIILHWLSIIRTALLACVIILFTVPHCVYK
ncbi:uncharacterized protein LOC125803842 [Astyanax mexicanus]|uniref:uncharacterized protein LOC125803842 n=1 Tax=Astyanax mexicanus TaxID=7994 RepID=UPI0020CAB0C1|nr:uncharacterized protein LOC125803842 [Astyanax mexicanus]